MCSMHRFLALQAAAMPILPVLSCRRFVFSGTGAAGWRARCRRALEVGQIRHRRSCKSVAGEPVWRYHRAPQLRTVLMYVCLCNGLTDAEVRDAAVAGASRPSEVYRACGRAVDCGGCAPTLRRILNEGGRAAELELECAA
jgi:bacterioferritin-associated ferredoxin